LTSGSGYLVVARTPQPAYDALGQLRAVLIPSAAVAAVVTAAVVWLSVRRSLGPLTGLVAAAEAIARRSDHRDRIGDGGRTDEIGRLAATIDSMLASLERSHQAETAAGEAQRRFLADVSHELRAPLTIMQSSLDLAERIRPGDPGVVDQVLIDMRGEVSRMSRRVTQLLVMARTGDRTSAHTPLLVGDLVAEVGARWRRTDPRVTYRCVVAPVDTAVSGDVDQLRQVLEILLENASTYTASNGSIDVMTTADDDTVTVAVTDNGVGISAEDLPRIFDRYHRANAPAATSGLGVGLSIARQLVSGHGGTITATSEPGRGSTFTVRLPRAGAE
jgi:two-component system OmpR family sensor kinase